MRVTHILKRTRLEELVYQIYRTDTLFMGAVPIRYRCVTNNDIYIVERSCSKESADRTFQGDIYSEGTGVRKVHEQWLHPRREFGIVRPGPRMDKS